MIKALLFDFSRTLLFPKDKNYLGGLNDLYKEQLSNPTFNFLENFELNKELFEYLKSIKYKYNLFIFTSESIQEDPAIKNDLVTIFERVFSAKQLGLSKKDSKAYEIIAKELNLNPSEILFVDDSLNNIDAATNAGLETMLYKDNMSLIYRLKSL